jgi:hypothetical protein
MDYAQNPADDDMPLTNEAECRAAWEFANSEQAADEYEPDELAALKTRIKKAGEKYGLHLGGEKVTAAAELRDVELARPGTWKLASGPLDVTARMLDDAARFANREGARPAFLKIGHTDTRFMAGDGEPALGWVHNVRLEEDDQGHVLKGDLTGMPDWLGTALPHHWPDRSIEGWADYEHDGDKYGLVMSGLALLGVTPPGMSSLKSLRDLPAALGLPAPVAAGARPIFASFGETQAPASEAEGPPPTRKGAGMPADPDEIREALGLDPDVSEEQVREAFSAVFPTPAGTPVAAAGAVPGTIVLASSTYEEMQRNIKVLTNHVSKIKRDERDEVIAKAVQAGKFTPAQKGHFATMWDSNPDATRSLIDALTPNSALAVMASGYAGETVEADELDLEIERLSPPRGKVA